MKEKLQKLYEDLNAASSYFMNVRSQANEIRQHYKYQNQDTDSTSESFILSFNDIENAIDCSIEEIKNLIEYEEQFECDCGEE